MRPGAPSGYFLFIALCMCLVHAPLAQELIKQLHQAYRNGDKKAVESLSKDCFNAYQGKETHAFLKDINSAILAPEEKFEFCLYLGELSFGSGMVESEFYIDVALRIADELAVDKLKAEAYLAKGMNSVLSGNWMVANQLLLQSLNLVDTLQDADLYYEILQSMATLEAEYGESEDAIELLEKVQAHYQRTKNKAKVASAKVDLGIIYVVEGDVERAAANFEEAVRLSTDNPDFLHSVYRELAYCKMLTAQYEEAKELYQKSASYYRSTQRYFDQIDPDAGLALAFAFLDEKDSALYYIDQALMSAETSQSVDKMIAVLDQAHQVYHQLGDNEKAYYSVIDMFNLENDSIKSAQVSQTYIDSREKYLSDQKEASNKLLQIENQQRQEAISRQRIFLILAGVLLLMAVGVVIYILRLQRRTQQLNQQISSQSLALRNANRTKDRLFSIIGHDMRGPITSFEALSGLIKNYLKNREVEKVDELIEHVDHSAKNLKSLLDNLLNWSLAQQNEISLNIRPLEIKPLIEEILEIYTEAARIKQISIEANLTDQQILGDYDTISTALRNLISNALKFSPSGSTISLGYSKSDRFVNLTIQDQGVGIPREVQHKLFSIDKTKVRKGTRNEKGTGLGLALVKEFVELNNGTIRFESEPGKGTIFFLSLPMAS